MNFYKITLTTPPHKICRYAGETRDIFFTGTRTELFKYIRWKTRTYEQLTEIKIKLGNNWLSDNGK